jgi:hypothetical protein
MDDVGAIARLIDALRPWHSQLVIVGGWAHRLHRYLPLASPPSYLAVRTKDADIAFAADERLTGDIGTALRGAKFREELSSDHAPPVTHYVLGGDDQGFYAEFLAPLRGSGYKRSGEQDATLTKAGVTAQKLRHLDLLLTAPSIVRLGAGEGIPLASPASVRIANPVSFIAQKLLIQKERNAGKQPQDALYIHDTLELFSGALEALKEQWLNQIRPTLPAKTRTKVERLSREQFSTVTDVIRNAVRIPQDRRVAPERMQALCAYGLEEIFGAAEN